MDKKRLFSSMTVIGYGLCAVFVILAIAVSIFLAINGFSKPEKKVDNIVFSMPENTEDVTTSNNTTSVSTDNLKKTIKFSIAGKTNSQDEIDYSTRKITVVINNSSTSFNPANKSETSVWFAQKNAAGEILADEEGNFIPVESNQIEIKVNDPITLILATTKYEEDDLNPNKDAFYIKGGISHIHARSDDALLQAQELKVQVDVPVENFELTVYGYDYNDTTGKKVDLTESIQKTAGISYKNIRKVTNEGDDYLNLSDTSQNYLGRTIIFTGESTSNFEKGKYYTVVEKQAGTIGWQENNDLRYFIKGTELELGIRAFPENSTSAILGSFKQAIFSIEPDDPNSAIIKEGTNLLSVVGFDPETTGSIKVVATLPVLLSGTERVETSIFVETAPYEIDRLEIQNEFLQGKIECLLNKEIKVGFNGSVQDADIGLDLKVIPKFFNGHNNPYENDFTSIYAELRTNHAETADPSSKIIALPTVAESFKNPISLFKSSSFGEEGKLSNKVISFTPTRLLFEDEVVSLIVSGQTSFSDTEQPYCVFQIKPFINKPIVSINDEVNELDYQRSLEIGFAKEDKNYIEVTKAEYNESELIDGEKITQEGSLSATGELKITYKKENERPIIYKTNNQNLFYKWVYFAEGGEGEFKSDVIMLSKTGQLKSPSTYGISAYAVGDGNINLLPKLVLCDKDGNPLNCSYKTFTVDENTGFLLAQNIKSTDLNDENENNYVVIFEPQITQKIVVIENLTEVTFFYDQNLTDKVEGDVEVIAGGSKSFYFVANSQKALKHANLAEEGERLTATLKMTNQDDLNLEITYDKTDYKYASFTISEKPADADCLVDLKVSESFVGSLKPQIKELDIQSIDAVFDVVSELKMPLLSKDENRRVLFVGESGTIVNTDGNDLTLEKNKFYVVASKTDDETGDTIYFWKQEEEHLSLNYNNNIKSINIKESATKSGVEIQSISFVVPKTEEESLITLPENPYVTLTLKQAHGYENLDVSGKVFGYNVFVLNNGNTEISVDNYSSLTKASKIKVVEGFDGKIKLSLSDGWKTELNGKHLFLVYTVSVSNNLKAVDSYRIDLDFTDDDHQLTKNTQVTLSGTPYDLNTLFVEKGESDSQTDIVKLIANNDATKIQDIKLLLNIDVATPSNFDYANIKVNLINEDSKQDYSQFVKVQINDAGKIIFEVAKDDENNPLYKITTENGENPMSSTWNYALAIKVFSNIENSTMFYYVEIPVKLGFNVANI